MDPAAFDALSRSLGGDVSRRSLLARLAAGLAPLLPLRCEKTPPPGRSAGASASENGTAAFAAPRALSPATANAVSPTSGAAA